VAKVLIFQANPQGTTLLRLNEEMRSIQQAAESNGFRSLEIQFLGAVRKDDLQASLIRYSPDIVHFCGHGTSNGELVLEDDSGSASVLNKNALSSIFANFSDSIKCVILNSCYSKKQAAGIIKHIPCIVGMTSLLNDQAAIAFSSKFYTGLANGYSIKRAFEIAKTEVLIYDKSEAKNPVLDVNSRYNASDVYISLFPSIQAKFLLSSAGNPIQRQSHFYMELFLMDIPRDVRSVVYQLLDVKNAPFNEQTSRLLNYTMQTALYGDIEIRATLWKNDGAGIGLSTTLGKALRQYYMSRKPSLKILNAIKQIESN
jgi:hypothetical protein